LFLYQTLLRQSFVEVALFLFRVINFLVVFFATGFFFVAVDRLVLRFRELVDALLFRRPNPAEDGANDACVTLDGKSLSIERRGTRFGVPKPVAPGVPPM
jgi:hypothetical protein